MEIEEPDEETGYLKQEDYLNKPQKPSSLKKPKAVEAVEAVEQSVEGVEKPVKKKRIMSEKQKASLARAREVSARKRKEKKALKLADETPIINKKVKSVKHMETIDEDTSSSEEDETPQEIIKKGYGSLKPPDSVEERVYQRIMAEKAQRRLVKQQKVIQAQQVKAYEESIREDERKKLYEMTQRIAPKKKQVNAQAMLQPNIWEQAFAPKRNQFGF